MSEHVLVHSYVANIFEAYPGKEVRGAAAPLSGNGVWRSVLVSSVGINLHLVSTGHLKDLDAQRDHLLFPDARSNETMDAMKSAILVDCDTGVIPDIQCSQRAPTLDADTQSAPG